MRLKITKKHQNNVIDVVLVFLLLTLNLFVVFLFVDFQQVNVTWVAALKSFTKFTGKHLR